MNHQQFYKQTYSRTVCRLYIG